MQKDFKEISITGATKVRDVQKEFASFYPFLKIEFSKNEHGIFSKNHKVNPENSLIKSGHSPLHVKLNVDEERTIAEVERDCHELSGLSIQICRKSGNVWNAISITNSWSLQSQNMAGEFISTEMQKHHDSCKI
ncbi:MAG: hypothetical protein JWR18_3376 [Segetibacter sp.]|jgi:hypothetical protein|nr:hypothetical protein [Segetibacter sp.]